MNTTMSLADQLREIANRLDAQAADAKWPVRRLTPSGATGPGIDGTQAGIDAQIALKVQYYLHPEEHGVQLNQEARLFRDAIRCGHVTPDADGLETLLAYLELGAIGPDARPLEITRYFAGFYCTDRG